MRFYVCDRKKGYQLPNSLSWLNYCQDPSMKSHGMPTLSQVKIFEILVRGEEYTLPYKLFIGVMRTNRNSKIIIVGEYLLDYPSDYGLFHHIEVHNSEIINFVCDSDSDSDSHTKSDRKSFDILHLQNNTYAVLFKTGVIIIGITPTFQNYLEENVDYDEGNYNDSYLYVKRFNFVRDITDSPFDTPITDCRDMRIDKDITSIVEKNDDNNSMICLNFSCVCSCSNSDCLTETHWSTENCIRIYISNKEIKIYDSRYKTTYDRYIVNGTQYNDFPTIRDFEENDSRYHEIECLLFPEDESEDESEDED